MSLLLAHHHPNQCLDLEPSRLFSQVITSNFTGQLHNMDPSLEKSQTEDGQAAHQEGMLDESNYEGDKAQRAQWTVLQVIATISLCILWVGEYFTLCIHTTSLV